jgi:hypothetical protein
MSRRTAVIAAGVLVTALLGATPASATTTPGVPYALRISTEPYAGFQSCEGGHPVVDTRSGLLAASPTPGSDGGPLLGPFPGLHGTFEVALPDQEAFLRRTTAIESNGHVFAYQVPQDLLQDGEYRWRVRAEKGTVASQWSPWCSFTVAVRQ